MPRLSSRRLAVRCALLVSAACGLSSWWLAAGGDSPAAASPGVALLPAGNGFSPESAAPRVAAGPWHAPAPGAQATLPSEASGAIALRDPSGLVSLGVRLSGARPAAAQRLHDGAHFPGALGEGTELLLRPRPDGVEDLVTFAARPAAERVDYLVDVRQVAGVRKIGRVVEFLDAGGAPRLRMEAPSIEGPDGRVAQADVEVGCAHDESPRAPWGRPVVAPGAEECRVTVRWEGRGVQYPAVLDPVWASVGSMVASRAGSSQALLADERLLVAGGRQCKSSVCTAITETEIFDPTTNTWALTGPLSVGRDRFPLVSIPSVGHVIFGGDEGPQESSVVEVYSESTGLWSLLPPLTTARADGMGVLLPDQKTVLVLGGIALNSNSALKSIEVYHGDTNTWSSGGNMLSARFWGTSTLLPDGKILAVGGTQCPNCGPQKTGEIYDPASQTSVAVPPISARLGHAAFTIPVQGAPAVVVIGGGTNKAEYFDPAALKWTAIGDMKDNRAFFISALRPDGSIIVAGGGTVPLFSSTPAAERLDPVSLTWSKVAPMITPRALAGWGQLNDGRLLVTGGVNGSLLTNGNTVNLAEVFQALQLAEPCQVAGECGSGFCSDGVCCNTACTGTCESCIAGLNGGQDGQCGFIVANTDPDEECPIDEKSTCGKSGACDGQGACALYPPNTPCGTTSCVDGLSTGQLCNAEHKCQQTIATCTPFLCQDSVSCGTSCDLDVQCITGAHCESKVCIPDLAVGAACDRASACQSGYCIDGVCCESACEGTCQACAAALKQDGSTDGTCGPAKLGTDPHDQCAEEPVASCDKNGMCDGAGSCALHPAGVACQPLTCTFDGGFRVDAFACDGSGTCQATSAADCGLFGCDAGACRASCGADADCAPGAYCDEGVCAARKALGAICVEARECAEGFCADGVCCNSACDGQCEACDVPKALGLCVPVSGAPHNKRALCPADPSGKACQQRTCDGVERKSCQGFVGQTVVCKSPSCADGVVTPLAFCDGKGQCAEQESIRCEPFACAGNACASACTADTDCAAKFRCDTAKGDCVPRTGAFCDGPSTLVNPDGSSSSCAPFACEGSACKTSCSSVLDCALPNICEESSRTCVAAAPNAVDDGGCQLSPRLAAPLSSSPFALLVMAAALASRRRR